MNKLNSGDWVYEYDKDYPFKYELTNVRYILGESFDLSIQKALVCIGVNPSIAIPESLDPTLTRVRKYARESKEYGAWYMLNIYPQRATDPDQMDAEQNQEIHLKNLNQIAKLFDKFHSADVWCAWGGLIDKRPYLKECLRDIAAIMFQSAEKKELRFLRREREGKEIEKVKEIRKEKEEEVIHPLHPIASVKTKGYKEFDLKKYVEQVCRPEREPGILYSIDQKVLIKYQPEEKVPCYVMPESVEQVLYTAFLHCPELTSLTISPRVDKIDFVFPENLEEILVDERSKHYVGRGGVLYSRIPPHYIRGLVRYPPKKKEREYQMLNVTGIVDNAFQGCTYLTSITLPSGAGPYSVLHKLPSTIVEVKTAKEDAYYNAIDGIVYAKDGSRLCYYPRARNVTRFHLPATVKSADFNAFEGCNQLRTLLIPADGASEIEFRNLSPASLEEFDVDEGNPYYMDLEGVLYSKDLKRLVRYPCGKKEALYYIPDGIERIEKHAFTGCRNLQTIVLPDSLKYMDHVELNEHDLSVFLRMNADHPYFTFRDGVLYTKDMKTLLGYNAFRQEASCVVPDCVEHIATCAFNDCSRLQSIEMPGVLRIDDYAFSGCTQLRHISMPRVQNIGEGAFYECEGLTSVQLPDSLVEIGSHAFFKCVGLQTIEIRNEHSRLGTSAFSECKNLRHATVASEYMSCEVFGDCERLESLTLTNKNKIEFEEYAFGAQLDNCKNVKCVCCYKSMFQQIRYHFWKKNILFLDKEDE